jgi:hypothetical protein
MDVEMVVEFTKVDPYWTPPTQICAPLMKPDPVTVIVRVPTGIGFGTTPVMFGPAAIR